MKPLIHDDRSHLLVADRAVGRKQVPHEWTAIILAGQRPEGDPLAERCGVKYKALIPIAGQSMLERVASTLLASQHIGKVVVMAQSPEALMTEAVVSLAEFGRIEFVESNDGIATSVGPVIGTDVAPWPVLVTTADNALLTTEILDCFLNGALDQDVAVGVVERQTVLTAYPDTQRTWLKFRDGAYSGANLFALRNASAKAAVSLWSSIEQDRKNCWKIFARFGPWLLFRAVSRTISFRAAMAEAGKRLSIDAQPVELPIPEAAIDVDKPDDLAMARQLLANRANIKKTR